MKTKEKVVVVSGEKIGSNKAGVAAISGADSKYGWQRVGGVGRERQH
jgi:pyruvate/2-oxoglutarate/acetoin dehydrogenase E1 component